MSDTDKLIDQLDKVLGPRDELTGKEKKAAFVEILTKLTEQPEVPERFMSALEKMKEEDRENIVKLITALKDSLPEMLDELNVYVKNQQEYPEEIKVSNFPDYPTPPEEVGVKEPKWYKSLLIKAVSTPIIEGVVTGFGDIVSKLASNVFRAKLEGPYDPHNPIAVRLSDGERFYNAVFQAVSGGGRSIFPFQNTTGQKQEALVDSDGHLQIDIKTQEQLPNEPWSYHYNGSSALTDQQVHAAPGTGKAVYITDIVISLGSNTAMNVFFEEGATTILGPYYLEDVSGRGLSLHFTTPKKCTDATAVTVTSTAAVAHAIDVIGFVG